MPSISVQFALLTLHLEVVWVYIGQYNKAKHRVFEQQDHIDPELYCAHGGAFPIMIKNSGVVGVVTVSGLPQVQDHQLIVDALAELVD